MLLWLDELHQEIRDLLKGNALLLLWVGVDTDVLDRRQLALAEMGVFIRVGKQQSFFGVVVAELEVDLLGFFEQPAVEVLLVVHLVEVERILFVFEVRALVLDLRLLVVLRLASSVAFGLGLAMLA